ncbi:MAG TPA: 2-oxo acid dehydrogenase subunit E2 [Peptococcaceae bacterium]|nr:2-oxo acid dehydrogenase subunit E2 [Peptococcaceae bacterium]
MRRSDGRPLKSIRPFMKIIPFIMTRRSDAQIFAKQIIVMDKIDAYLKEKRQQEHNINYLHLFIAIYVRVIAERPQLNRFVMSNKLYARNGIYVSMAVKRLLKDEGEETTVKFSFKGHEDIFEIAKIINSTLAESTSANNSSDVDKIAARIMALPYLIKKVLIGTLKGLDKLNMLPRFIIEASPFHTTLFFTYLKSIKLDYIYHHLYDFGTTGLFVSLGKVKKMPVVENNTVVVKDCCEIGYTIDERICDGLYFANSLKLVKKYLNNPYLLETKLDKVEADVE